MGMLIEVGTKKWPKEESFTLFRQTYNKSERSWQAKEYKFGCLISKELKPGLGFSSKLVKK